MSTLKSYGVNSAQCIKESMDPATFYRLELPTFSITTRKGWVNGGLCPFHLDHNAGSFRINLTTGSYICFSCGAKGGDIIAFTMQRYPFSFGEALDYINESGD